MIIWHNYTMVITLTLKMWCDYKVVIILTLVIWHKFSDGNYSNFANLV